MSWIHKCYQVDTSNCIVCSKFLKLSSDSRCKSIVSKSNLGARAIMLHAMDDDKLDEKKTQLSRLTEDEALDFSKDLPTCELVFRAKNNEDYHNQMNADIFLGWFEHRLIPSLKCHEIESAVIFLDQATYHTVRTGVVPTSEMNKNELIEVLRHHGVERVKILRYNNDQWKRLTWTLDKCSTRAPQGPYKQELMVYAYKYILKNNPGDLEPEICKIARNHGHYIVFGCPNNPEEQAFEFCNAHVKRYVKKTYRRGRTFEQLRNDIFNGWKSASKSQQNINSGMETKMRR